MIVTTFVCLFVLSGDIKIIEQNYSLTGMTFTKEQNKTQKRAKICIISSKSFSL